MTNDIVSKIACRSESVDASNAWISEPMLTVVLLSVTRGVTAGRGRRIQRAVTKTNGSQKRAPFWDPKFGPQTVKPDCRASLLVAPFWVPKTEPLLTSIS
jgi:hypothetical protein